MITKLIWRNLWRNKRRTVITVSSIGFAVMFSILMKSLQDGIFDNLIKNIVSYYSGHVQIHQKGYWDEQNLDNSFALQNSTQTKLLQNPNIHTIAPRLETFVLISKGISTKGCMLIGTDTNKENDLTQLKSKLVSGNYFQNEEQKVIIAQGLAKKLNLKINDTIVLFGQGFHSVMAAGKYQIKGIVQLALPAMNERFVYLPIKASQSFLSATNQVTSISININKPENLESIHKKIKESIGNNYEVMSWQQMMPEIANHIKADGYTFYVFSAILYLIIGFGLFGTILMMTIERKYEFGMLIAIGMKKSKLALILLGETILITLIGILLGILISLPFVIYLSKKPFRLGGEISKAYEQFGFEAIFPATLDKNIFITQSIIVLIIAFLIGLYPLWHINQLDPIKAMKK